MWETKRHQEGLLGLSRPYLVCVHISGPSLLEMKFFQNLFSPSFSSFFEGFLNQLSNTTHLSYEHDITRYTNVFIASDKIVSAAYLGI